MARAALTRLERLRRSTDRFVHHHVVELVLLLLIVVSVVFTVIEVVTTGQTRWWVEVAGDVLTTVFAVELTARFWVARKKSRFFERYWIDILAILPVVRPLRFFRVLRVLRLFRAGVLFNRRISGFQGGYRDSSGEPFALVLGSVTLVILCALVLLLTEGPFNPQLDGFEEAMWFAGLTLVGGEPIGAFPQTEVGRWTTLLLMVGGLTLFGVFVGAVSAGMVTRLQRRLEVHELDIDELVGHVVVCGWNQSAATVLHELFAPDTPMQRAVVVVTETELPRGALPDKDVRVADLYTTVGDYTRSEVLEGLNLQEAESVILLADNLVPRSAQDGDARTVLAALTIERMVPDIYTVAELHSRQNEELLRLAGVEDVVVADFYAGMILGSVQRNRGLMSVLHEILTGSRGNSFQTYTVPTSWDGRAVDELHRVLFVSQRALLVSLEKRDGIAQVNPDPLQVVSAGDRVVVLAGPGFRLDAP